jgi:hypothetical protein
MRTNLVYVDDAAHALAKIGPELTRGDAQHWVLVACAPKMTHRISKWVSHTARENWRAKWADKLFSQLVPALQRQHQQVTTYVARGPLPPLTDELLQRFPNAQLQDLRRPKMQDPAAAVEPTPAATQPATVPVVTLKRRWNLSGTLASVVGMSLVFSE